MLAFNVNTSAFCFLKEKSKKHIQERKRKKRAKTGAKTKKGGSLKKWLDFGTSEIMGENV
ncbi:MAG: hypothetical protein IJL92_08740 [Thermoguttaceae bacterium]|nr:hypothetical protein [Thermoguttaceae bacterium]